MRKTALKAVFLIIGQTLLPFTLRQSLHQPGKQP